VRKILKQKDVLNFVRRILIILNVINQKIDVNKTQWLKDVLNFVRRILMIHHVIDQIVRMNLKLKDVLNIVKRILLIHHVILLFLLKWEDMTVIMEKIQKINH